MSKTGDNLDEKTAALFNRNRALNNRHQHLQVEIEKWQEEFCAMRPYNHPVTGERIDFPENGMLGHMLKTVPIIVYDLPELRARCDTAFVTSTRGFFMSAAYAKGAIKGQYEGRDSLYFVMRHEMEHLRRMHFQRLLDIDPETANIAADIRINIDIVQIGASVRLTAEDTQGKVTIDRNSDSFKNEVIAYYNNMDENTRSCLATNYAAYNHWGDKSEEAIAQILLAEKKNDPPKPPQNDTTLKALCAGIIQDFGSMDQFAEAHIKDLESKNQSDSKFMTVSRQVAINGRNKTIADKKQFQSVLSILGPQLTITATSGTESLTENDAIVMLTAMFEVIEADEMFERNQQHAALPGPVRMSVVTGDYYVDTLKPIERSMLLIHILREMLKPGEAFGFHDGQMSTNAADEALNKRKRPLESAGFEGTPEANVNSKDEHSMTGEELADILNKAGMKDVVKKLGYDDLTKISAEEAAAKQSISSAINEARDDESNVGASRIPGGHMVDAAYARMNDFFTPVLTLKMTMKKVMQDAVGSDTRYDPEEAWIYSQMSAEDLGVASDLDIPMNGSHVPGDLERKCVAVLIDTSGSVSDSQLKRLTSEAINMGRNVGGTPPDVLIIFADTIARGEPVMITEDNYQTYLNDGIPYGGRGGTSLQASMQNCYELFSENGPYAKTELASLIYLTDTYDDVPQIDALADFASERGFKKLPTHLFIAPLECYNFDFQEGVKAWADVIFFDPKVELTIDLDEIEISRPQIQLDGSSLPHAEPAEKPKRKRKSARTAVSP